MWLSAVMKKLDPAQGELLPYRIET